MNASTATAEPVTSPPSSTTAALYDRTARLVPARNLAQKLSRRLVDCFEARIVAASGHPDLPIYSRAHFPWVAGVEADWRKARAEVDAVMQYRDQMPSFQDIIKEVGTIQKDDQWKTFFLCGVGMDCTENARRCPETMRLLQQIPGMTTAFFSILSPRKHIPAHRGPYVGVLRLHLGLLVPEPRERCRIRIGEHFRHWTEGECLVFDDTFNHEVWNDTDGYRVVLFVDFARPLRPPYDRLNRMVVNMATLAPFIREAKGKQKTWEKRFYRKG